MGLPDNFHLLHEGEELIRAKSIEAISSSEMLTLHARVIECSMDLIDYFVPRHDREDDYQLIIQCLGIRLFNGMASSINLLFAGYYQIAALQEYDILETGFLLDYFSLDRKLISHWRTCDEDRRLKQFGPAAVRKALDARDSFTERKCEAHYKIFCQLAGHPTYVGFRMLTPIPGDNAHCRPFFEFKSMEATLSELAKLAVHSNAIFGLFFKNRKREDSVTKLNFMELQGRWFEEFYGQPLDRAPLEEMRKLLAGMR